MTTKQALKKSVKNSKGKNLNKVLLTKNIKQVNKNTAKPIKAKISKEESVKKQRISSLYTFCFNNSVIFKIFKRDKDEVRVLNEYVRMQVIRDITTNNSEYYLINLNTISVDDKFVGRLLIKDVNIYDDNNVMFVLEKGVIVTAETHASIKSNKSLHIVPNLIKNEIKRKTTNVRNNTGRSNNRK